MKIRRVILIALCLMFLFSQTATAADTTWKEYLRNFLVNNFPSLFDEATIKKNEELFELWNWGNSDFKPDIDDIPIDALYPYLYSGNYDYLKNNDYPVKDKWMTYGYYPLLLPHNCRFYDLDFDGIPEVVVSYPNRVAEGYYDFVYKLIGSNYESIYPNIHQVYFYKNTQNKLVVFEGFYMGLSSVYFADIIDDNMIFNDYIDLNGNTIYTLNGLFGEPTYDISDFGIFEDLTPLPEFDCSDVLNAIKYGTPLNPQNGDTNIIIFSVVLSMACFISVKLKKVKKLKG